MLRGELLDAGGRAAAARRDAAAAQPTARRRGGLGDAGGMGKNGELPAAAPRPVASDEELAAELGAVAASLGTAAEWTARVEALLRLEGLVLGGAAERSALPELLLPLRDALAAQLQERRSAVSRQACHAVCLLAAAMGDRMEPLSLALLPALFKALAMGIQVVSEAADACAHTIVRHCRSAKLLPRLCTTAAGDKSGRLRHAAAELLLQVLEEWPPAAFERQAQDLERAMLAAARDAQGETRVVGRTMYAAYAHTCPGPASALLLSLGSDRSLQDKLGAAVRSYVPGAPSGSGASQPPSRSARGEHSPSSQSMVAPSLPRSGSGLSAGAMRPPVPRLALSSGQMASSSSASPSARAGSARGAASLPPWQQQQRENLSDNQHELAAAATAAKPPIGRSAAASRRSMGGAALRISLAAAREEIAQEESSAAAAAAVAAGPSTAAMALGGGRAAPRRVSVNPGALRIMRPVPPLPPMPPASASGSAGPLTDRLPSARSTATSLDQQASFAESEASLLSSVYHGTHGEPSAAQPLSQLLSAAARAGVTWSDRVDAFWALEAAVQGSGPAAADVAGNAERLVATLLDGVGDAHFKIASAALQALGAGLAGPSSHAFEPHLDRLVPALFVRATDSKEQIRGLAATALAALPTRHSPDAVLAALAKALAVSKAPRVRCAIMDHFSSATSDPALGPLLGGQGSGLRALISGAMQLAGDKNPDTRRSALRMLATAYKAADPGAVQAALDALPRAAADAMHKPLSAAIAAIDVSGLEAEREQQQQEQRQGAAACTAAAAEDAAALAAASTAVDREAAVSVAASGAAQLAEALATRCSATAHTIEPSSSPASGRAAGTPQPAAAFVPVLPARTPQPPSPFVWRAASASPAPAGPAAEAEPVQQQEQPEPPPAAAPQAMQVSLPTAEQQQQQEGEQPPAPPLDCVVEAQLRRLLGQLQSGANAFEALQGLSRVLPVLPASVCAAHLNQMLAAAFVGLESGDAALEEAAALLVRDLAATLPPAALQPAVPKLLPCLLDRAARKEQAPEAAVAAEEALEAVLRRVDPEPCLGVLVPRLPALEEARLATPQLAATRCLRHVLARLPAAAVAGRAETLLPGLRVAFCSKFTDLRKAAVDCLVPVCLAAGEAVAEPHLAPLTAGQRKLLGVYLRRAVEAGSSSSTP